MTRLLARGSESSACVCARRKAKATSRADLVIGADGRHSTVRDKSGLTVRTSARRSTCCGCACRSRTAIREPVARAGPRPVLRDDQSRRLLAVRHDHSQGRLSTRIKAEGLSGFRAPAANLSPALRATASRPIASFDQVKLLTRDGRPAEAMVAARACSASAMRRMPCRRSAASASIWPSRTRSRPPISWDRCCGAGAPRSASCRSVQTRREFPTKVIQGFQVQAQNRVLAPTLIRSQVTPKRALDPARCSIAGRGCASGRRALSASACGRSMWIAER